MLEMTDQDAIATPPAELAGRLAGTRGLLLDLDGVLVRRGEAIPGAVEAMERLAASGIPYRILTNTSLVSRRTLALQLGVLGFRVPEERIVTALSAAAAHTRRTFPERPLYVLAAPDARREFAGQWLVSHAEADRPGMAVDAVVIGDSREELTYANVNRAFRFLREGAAFVAVHRNPWWTTAAGPTIDAGLFVAGLEYATGRTAIVAGKPSTGFFLEAASRVAAEVAHAGTARAPASEATGAGPDAPETTTARPDSASATPRADSVSATPLGGIVMVGDDLLTDVAGGRAAGLATLLVLTGKASPDDVASAARGEPPASGEPIVPTAVAASIGALVAALG
jgi:HAD superfamily hydrolase (TIGR01450 family)